MRTPIWLLHLMLLVAVRAQAADRPNVLWICADDHAAYVYGAYGSTQVRTPRLDRLAAEGVRFTRAYCNAPVCTASRQSFLTGRYPHSVGVTRLSTPLPESEVTLAEMLEGARYQTAAIGKMHFNSPSKHGFATRLDMPDYRKALAQRGAAPPPGGVAVQPPWRPFKDPARMWLNSACLPYGAVDADMSGTYFAEQAAQFLRAQHEQPFFLMVSFYEPHSPFNFPVEYRGRHHAAGMKAPSVNPADDWQIPSCFRDLSDDEKRGIMAAYYTSVEFLDKNVGIVLDALAASGRAENTIVIYTGDHGYMLGQHGRFEKHCSFEPAVRAPLVIKAPAAKPGGATGALVEFVDIVPTVLDLCGVTVPKRAQGRSLVNLLTGAADRHRDCVFVEYAENEEALVRTDRWKLVYATGRRERQDGYATGRPLPGRTVQLFDMADDPDEITNLAARPEHAALVHELTDRLAAHMRSTSPHRDDIPADADAHAILERCLPPLEGE
ncbi:MAG: sulfatase-like hydrolase/transferase [Planctomycetia bacterium]|nr:sulfatase-like hydrolase/transferase [Planctomycetia bacterium]